MRIRVAAVGRARRAPEGQLCDAYLKRIRTWGIELREVEVRGGRDGPVAEAAALRSAIPVGAHLVALDPGGRTLDSLEFAQVLDRWAVRPVDHLVFLIGGADGLSPDLLKEAAFRLSLGSMTWPHLLARVMLVEQIYRAQQILAGHPYHRA